MSKPSIHELPHENVGTFIAYALKVEQEAELRFGQLADAMGAAGNGRGEDLPQDVDVLAHALCRGARPLRLSRHAAADAK